MAEIILKGYLARAHATYDTFAVEGYAIFSIDYNI